MGHSSAGPINKGFPSFTSSLTRILDRDGRHSKHLSLLKEVFALTVFALS